GPPHDAALQLDFHLDGRVPARVQDLAPTHVSDRAQPALLSSREPAVHQDNIAPERTRPGAHPLRWIGRDQRPASSTPGSTSARFTRRCKPDASTTSTETPFGTGPLSLVASHSAPSTNTMPEGSSGVRATPRWPIRPSRPVTGLSFCERATRRATSKKKTAIVSVTSTIVQIDSPTQASAPGTLNSSSEPSRNDSSPPPVKTPWVG